MTEKVSATPLKCSKTAEIFRTNEALNLMADNPQLDNNEGECSKHPCAPHGFNRNASHMEDRYVCDCEGWSPDRTCAGLELQARLEALEAGMRQWEARMQLDLAAGKDGYTYTQYEQGRIAEKRKALHELSALLTRPADVEADRE